MTGEGEDPPGRRDEEPEERHREPPGEEGPVGLFPSWTWLYGTVLAWFVVVVVVLYVLTVVLDFGAP